MEGFTHLLQFKEDWLIQHSLGYAQKFGYTKYTPPLHQAWHAAISKLNLALSEAWEHHREPPELDPDADYLNDPIAEFAVTEAQNHRERGVSLAMFLGLLKYFRHSYIDLISQEGLKREVEHSYKRFLTRVFDRMEIAVCSGWSNLSRDRTIAELQLANRRLTTEKNEYLTIFESVSNPLILFGEDLRVRNLNYSAAKLFGFTRNPGEIYYSKDKPRLEWLESALKEFWQSQKREDSFEYKYSDAKDTYHFNIKFAKMLDVGGNYQGIVATLEDVTTRKRMEDDLKESEEKFRVLVEGSVSGVILTVGENFIYANRAFQEMSGYNLTELVGKSVADIFIASPEAGKNQVETKIINKNRRIADVICNYGIVYISGEKGVIGMVADITEHKKIEREKEALIEKLESALSEVKTLSGLIPICAWCKKVRDDRGYWGQVEDYIREHSSAEFTHGLCPDCYKKMKEEYLKE
jgi:PAS domain S-box-containing protein